MGNFVESLLKIQEKRPQVSVLFSGGGGQNLKFHQRVYSCVYRGATVTLSQLGDYDASFEIRSWPRDHQDNFSEVLDLVLAYGLRLGLGFQWWSWERPANVNHCRRGHKNFVWPWICEVQWSHDVDVIILTAVTVKCFNLCYIYDDWGRWYKKRLKLPLSTP